MSSDFIEYYRDLRSKAAAKSKALEDENTAKIGLIKAYLAGFYVYGMELCGELQHDFDSLMISKTGDSNVQILIGDLRFDYKLMANTGFGPRLFREVLGADGNFTRWLHSTPTPTVAMSTSGADYGQRHVDDGSRDKFRAHIFACLKVFAEYQFKNRI